MLFAVAIQFCFILFGSSVYRVVGQSRLRISVIDLHFRSFLVYLPISFLAMWWVSLRTQLSYFSKLPSSLCCSCLHLPTFLFSRYSSISSLRGHPLFISFVGLHFLIFFIQLTAISSFLRLLLEGFSFEYCQWGFIKNIISILINKFEYTRRMKFQKSYQI